MSGKKVKEHEAMTAEEIRKMREQERIDSIYPDKLPAKEKAKVALKYAAFIIAAVVLFVLFWQLVGFLSSISNTAIGYLGVIDDSSGFLFEFVNKLLHLAAAAIVTSMLGFSLKKSRAKRIAEILMMMSGG